LREEKESEHGKKNKFKTGKNLFLPLLHVQWKKKNSVVQNDIVSGFSSFFLNEQCMKQHCFDQNTSFQLKHGVKIC
jgi:hypothetical protein